MTHDNSNEVDPSRPSHDEVQQIVLALRGLRFGVVNIVVQDGVVIQIDRTEKRRLRNRTGATQRSR